MEIEHTFTAADQAEILREVYGAGTVDRAELEEELGEILPPHIDPAAFLEESLAARAREFEDVTVTSITGAERIYRGLDTSRSSRAGIRMSHRELALHITAAAWTLRDEWLGRDGTSPS